MGLESPEEDDLRRIAQQWVAAGALVQESCDGALDGTVGDLDRIQAVLDSGRLSSSDTYELQCLGIAFGQVLVQAVEGMNWSVIDDEYGRDPTVRYEQTSLQFNVLTTISKRVESGEPVEVSSMFDWIRNNLDDLLSRFE